MIKQLAMSDMRIVCGGLLCKCKQKNGKEWSGDKQLIVHCFQECCKRVSGGLYSFNQKEWSCPDKHIHDDILEKLDDILVSIQKVVNNIFTRKEL